MTIGLIIPVIVVVAVVAAILIRARARHHEQRQSVRRRQRAYIRAYAFPSALTDRLREVYPQLSTDDVAVALDGLRQFFLACLSAQDGGIARNVGMPSKVVDDAWHEFLLMTREYHAFCTAAFGEYLHHTPRALMQEPHKDALANTLHQLTRPGMLVAGSAVAGAAVPALFMIDRNLNIADGYRYDADDLGEIDRRRRSIVSGGEDGGYAGHALVCADRRGTGGCGGGGGCSGGGGCGDGGGGCGGGGCGGS